MPQRVLAEALKVTPRAVTGLVDALVADGLVTREPHPGDRRATLVTFTSRGETLVAQLKRDHKALARALFAPMSSRELDGFARGLGGLSGLALSNCRSRRPTPRTKVGTRKHRTSPFTGANAK